MVRYRRRSGGFIRGGTRPYVGLLVQGAIATVFVIASLVGTTVKNAYLVLTQTTLVLFFIPYLYLFLAYLRLRRERTFATALAGLVGTAAPSSSPSCSASSRRPMSTAVGSTKRKSPAA